MEQKPQYWFNTKTDQVEEGLKSFAMDRIGPFDTAEEARNALQMLADRARKQREEEERED